MSGWDDPAYLVLRRLYPGRGPKAVADELYRRFGWRPSVQSVQRKAALCGLRRKRNDPTGRTAR